jgi:glycosyltransferase involved in cell wall biosynthesis
MHSKLPPIALLITTYNRQYMLERALLSLEEEIPLLDIIVADDGSNPPITIERFPHYPITLIRLEHNQGAMAASNEGLKHIYSKDYEYIARLDSDDVVINGRFSKQLSFLKDNPDIGVVGAHFYVVNSSDKILSLEQPPTKDAEIRNKLFMENVMHHPTWMMRTDIAKKVGFYNTNYIAGGDTEFCWRLLQVTKAANIPEPLIKYQVGSKESISRSRRFIQLFNTMKLKIKYFDLKNPYAYMGLVISVLDILYVLAFVRKIRKLLS